MLDYSRWHTGFTALMVASCTILVFQASASRRLAFEELDTPIPNLRALPMSMGSWLARSEESLEPNIVEYLKPDDYVLRDYVGAEGNARINLFVAHFKSLQKTYGPHAPRICLPGSGWLETSSKLTSMAVPGRPEGIPVNQLTYEKSAARILVLYWYQNDRDIWAEEFRAKLRLLPDLIRYRRSDVGLVRLIAPLREQNPSQELGNCTEFTKLVFPSLAERFRTK